MNNKLNNMLKEFMEKNGDIKDIDEANKKLQEFIMKYNNDEIEYENTPLDDAYDLLEKAHNAKSKKQALKYAKDAYKLCSACFDAILFQVDLEENSGKRMKLLDEGLKFEEDRLRKEGFFDKDSIGNFYGIFETRPYIRGLYDKARYYFEDGKLNLAKKVCMEVLRLNEHDNTGIRYMLMAIYACLEDEKSMLSLRKKYSENSFSMLFPMFVLYYRLGNDKKACEYLKKAYNANKNLLKFFKGTMKVNDNMAVGYYSMGDSSELIMYFSNYSYLFLTLPSLPEYVIENLKK